MKSFQYFLNESEILNEETLTHITHLEDLIFYNRPDAIVKQVNEILKGMSGGESGGFSIKFDGAPAIIAGINPENGKFFVATKSLFNKTPKINYTDTDCDINHKGELAKKLKCALKYLSPLFPKGLILQGDLLFGGVSREKTIEKIDGVKYLTFTPNSLTYAIPSDSALAKSIKQAKIGVVWHTTYTGPTISTLGAAAGATTNLLKTTPDVFTLNTDMPDTSDAFISPAERKAIRTLLSVVKDAPVFNPSKTLLSYLNMFTNDQFRNLQTKTMQVQDFTDFVQKRIEKWSKEVKTPALQQKRLDTFYDIVEEIKKCKLEAIFKAHNALYRIKNIILHKLVKVQSFASVFMKQGDGSYKVTSDEGYVFAGKTGSIIKIVDRIGFSLYNFQNSKMR